MTTNSITDSEKQELEKLRQFRDQVWGLACECSSDWMIIDLGRIEDYLKIPPNKYRVEEE